MRWSKSLAGLAMLLLLFLAGPFPVRAQSCESITSGIASAAGSPDLDRLAALYSQAQSPAAACSETAIYCLGRGVALGYVAAAEASAEAGRSETEIAGLLRRGMAYGGPWKLLARLGEVESFQARASKDPDVFRLASEHFQRAIEDIGELADCSAFGEEPPATGTIGRIETEMQEAVLLAPELIVTTTRDGQCGGVFRRSVRGFTPEARPLPITFPYDSSEFTGAGKQAAEILLECLRHDGPAKRIVLSGHTDMLGSDAYNMDLSARRLDSVKRFLVAGGYTGEIVLLPKGKSEPFKVDDPTQYTQAEIDQMNRRVELRGQTE